jgi:hypothetical protein
MKMIKTEYTGTGVGNQIILAASPKKLFRNCAVGNIVAGPNIATIIDGRKKTNQGIGMMHNTPNRTEPKAMRLLC